MLKDRIFILFFLISFSVTAQNLEIKGKLTNNAHRIIYLYTYSNEPEIVDSTAIISNNFLLKASIKDKGFFFLKLSDDKTMILLLTPGDKIVLEANAKNFAYPIKLSGSEENSKLHNLNKQLAQYEKKQDSLNKVYEKNMNNPLKDSIVDQLRIAFDIYAEKQNKLISEFINANLNSVSGLLFIGRLNINQNMDLYIKYDSAVFKSHPNNIYVKSFHDEVNKNLRLAVGNVAPDIIEKDTAGNIVKLSSLRGKVVLIDFWASWCGPCRRESPHMVRLYNEYKDKGFEIFGVSLDKDRKPWLNAIKHDKLFWTHVSDLGYWNSKNAGLYNVSSIPYTVLIDKNGKILAKGLYGQEIDQKLKELFQ